MNTEEHPNATAYRRTVDAFRAGDFDAIWSVFHFHAGRQVERWMYPDDAAAWDGIFDG